jgi:dihydroorotate dehydrogenase (NAD+) catalytic subunit
VDLSVRLGEVALPNPVMTASGTAGYGTELARYLDLGRLGALVVKSLAVEAREGNPAPRIVPTEAGMLNSVGLQGPGVAAWMERQLPALVASGARVVASIWGRTVEEYAEAARLLAEAPPQVVAVEVNVSCPNVAAGRRPFGQCPSATAEVLEATGACRRPRWAKLAPDVADICELAAAALAGGAAALTLVNTLPALAIDVEARRPALGAGPGGLSGPGLRPVAVKAVFDCRAAFPQVPIVGVGGVATGRDALEMVMAGADAVQVGTASFADPRAPAKVAAELERWCRRHGVARLAELRGAAHG